jgi:hypothetical protein
LSCGPFPRPDHCKQAGAIAAVALALAGCGGSGDGTGDLRTVRGIGYSYLAPAAWQVRASGRTKEASGDGSAVSVTRFRLARPFRMAQWPAAVRELDGVATRLADELGGRVADRRTIRLGGRDARVYALEDTDDGTSQIGFVLDGRAEYQLLCRGGSDQACARLFSSFRLA